MAKLRIFISSTYYDLKHARERLGVFIEGFGYEPVLSEEGSVSYDHDVPLDKACYAEISKCDLVILIIGGRYGSMASTDAAKDNMDTYYTSITLNEYKKAYGENIPIYIFIDKDVDTEYNLYLNNQDKDINYKSVDTINVFKFIKEVRSKIVNNICQTFNKVEEIETWLKKQWSGQFQKLLSNKRVKQIEASHPTNSLKEEVLPLKIFLDWYYWKRLIRLKLSEINNCSQNELANILLHSIQPAYYNYETIWLQEQSKKILSLVIEGCVENTLETVANLVTAVCEFYIKSNDQLKKLKPSELLEIIDQLSELELDTDDINLRDWFEVIRLDFIGICYMNIGHIELSQEKYYSMAADYFEFSLRKVQEIKQSDSYQILWKGYITRNLGQMYHFTNNVKLAEEKLRSSLRYRKRVCTCFKNLDVPSILQSHIDLEKHLVNLDLLRFGYENSIVLMNNTVTKLSEFNKPPLYHLWVMAVRDAKEAREQLKDYHSEELIKLIQEIEYLYAN